MSQRTLGRGRRIVEASNDSVVAAYEKRIAKLEREKLLALEKLSQIGRPKHTFEESFEHAMRKPFGVLEQLRSCR